MTNNTGVYVLMKKNYRAAVLLCAACLIFSQGCTSFIVRNTPDEPTQTADDSGFSFELDDTPNNDLKADNVLSSKAQSEKEEKSTIKLDAEKTDPEVGQTIKATVTVTPDQNAGYTIVSENEDIVAVNDNNTLTAVSEGKCIVTAALKDDETVSDTLEINVTAPKDPDQDYYADGILIVNKKYYITEDYNPGGLTLECYSAFEQLTQAAAEDGISIYALSDFRSYEDQEAIYKDYVMQYGQEGADSLCALPGHSEHQTGLAIDCATYDSGSFTGSAAAAWLDEHCAEYGFIIRYPEGHQSATGYTYEPWHIRYIGKRAKEITDSGLSLEEYFGLTE